MKKEVKQRYDDLGKCGCLIGEMFPEEWENCGGPLERHHLTSIAQRTRDDMRTICLCAFHHQRQSPLQISYHKTSKKFRAKFGTDDQLLAMQNKLLEELHERA